MRIIYFDIDSLRPDHLGCYGYSRPTSPTIDSIAEQGVCFGHYYCASSPCLPSRTSWSSGRFGIRNGVLSNFGAGAQFRIENRRYGGAKPHNEMFMRQLRKHGYDTVSFSNFADRHNALWFMCGWSEFHTPNLKSGSETADEVNVPVLNWLKHSAKNENYFLHVNYWDVHRCYKMDAAWADPLKEDPIPQSWPDEDAIRKHQSQKGPFTATCQFKNNESNFPLMPGAISSRADFEHMITGYDAAIRYVDSRIKIVLDELERQNILEETMIIISADHGDAFGEHGIYSDHVNADECIHRVPLIVKGPSISASSEHAQSFWYNVDFAPTLCSFLDIPAASGWDGISFSPCFSGEPLDGRDFLVWDCGLYTVQRAIRTKTHLMIRTYDDYGYDLAPIELYDMLNDPYQTRNIAAQQPNLVAKCSQLMESWVREQLDKSPGQPDPLREILRERKKAPPKQISIT